MKLIDFKCPECGAVRKAILRSQVKCMCLKECSFAGVKFFVHPQMQPMSGGEKCLSQ